MTNERSQLMPGNPRVRQRVVTCRRAAAATLTVILGATLMVARSGETAAATSQTSTDATRLAITSRMPVNQLKVMNYYPRSGGWKAMWTNFQPAGIDHDFGVIAALHGNAVRLILDTATFQNSPKVMMNELKWTVSAAKAHGLAVQLTLFDDMSSWLSVGASKAWVDMVVRPFVSDSTVALIELINEKPWPTDTAGIAWAKALIPHIQQVDGGIPVAVSIPLNDADPYAYWIGKLKSALAPVAPDVWDIHYYGLASLAKETFTSSKAVAAPQPLVIGETGKWTDGTDASERAQSSYLYDVSVGAAGANLPAPAPWILYDIRKVETFGLYRADGRAKPAAATMQWVFSNWRWPQTRSRTLQ